VTKLINNVAEYSKTNGMLQGLMLADELLTINGCPMEYRFLIINKANEIMAEHKQKEKQNESAQIG